ncbi:MAG: hypothetical protein QG599_372 [Pseudomonadota bacterium]|nr:hypothetical protein [Pseudomonadota bacterium]
MDWTQQWKQEDRQEGLTSERRLLLQQTRRRFGEVIAMQSTLALEQIEQLAVFEDLGEELFDCADETVWLGWRDCKPRQWKKGTERH